MDKPHTKEEADAAFLIAEDNLMRAIQAITDCLEYEFENEFMPEFEMLNARRIQWLVAKQRRNRIARDALAAKE